MMFCFDVGEWWMTHGPCTSEIKAVNIFMNVCGSPDLHALPLYLTRLAFHLYVNVRGIIVPLKLAGPSGDFWSRPLLSAGLTSKSDLVAEGQSSFCGWRFLNVFGNLFQGLTTLLWVHVLVLWIQCLFFQCLCLNRGGNPALC